MIMQIFSYISSNQHDHFSRVGEPSLISFYIGYLKTLLLLMLGEARRTREERAEKIAL